MISAPKLRPFWRSSALRRKWWSNCSWCDREDLVTLWKLAVVVIFAAMVPTCRSAPILMDRRTALPPTASFACAEP